MSEGTGCSRRGPGEGPRGVEAFDSCPSAERFSDLAWKCLLPPALSPSLTSQRVLTEGQFAFLTLGFLPPPEVVPFEPVQYEAKLL